MWGNTPVSDFSRKTLVTVSPVRLRSGLTGTLAAQPPQTLSSVGTGCYASVNQGCSRQTLGQMALEAGLGPPAPCYPTDGAAHLGCRGFYELPESGPSVPGFNTSNPGLCVQDRLSRGKTRLSFSHRNTVCLHARANLHSTGHQSQVMAGQNGIQAWGKVFSRKAQGTCLWPVGGVSEDDDISKQVELCVCLCSCVHVHIWQSEDSFGCPFGAFWIFF